jgi:hypothetical protein
MKRNVKLNALKVVSVVTVAAAVLAMIPSVDAACSPARRFGQSPGPANGYFYVFMPANSTNTHTSIIGRFWQQGNRAAGNEGVGCPDDIWLPVCNVVNYPCGGNPTGKTRYIAGGQGETGPRGTCDNIGCVQAGDMDLLVQDTNTVGGANFFMARVQETPALPLAYDFSQINQNLAPIDIPRPFVTSSTRSGSNILLDLRLDPVNTGFYSFPIGTPVVGNISGVRIHTFTGTAEPSRDRTAWVADTTSRPYTGNAIVVPGFIANCSNTTTDVFVSAALEFDNGQFTSDYVSGSMRVECDPNVSDPNRFRMIQRPDPGQKPPKR